MTRSALVALAISLSTLAIGCGGEDGTGPLTDSADLNDLPTAADLLAEAIALTETRGENNECATGSDASAVIEILQQAVRLDSSEKFRQQIAANELLSREFGQMLIWKAIIGTLRVDAKGFITGGLEVALSEGVTFWDTYGSAVPTGQYTFRKGTVLKETFDVDEYGGLVTSPEELTWAVDAKGNSVRVTNAAGEQSVWTIKFEDRGSYYDAALYPSDTPMKYDSIPLECESAHGDY